MEENNSKELNLLDLIRMFFNWLKRLGWGFLRLLGNWLRMLCRNWAVTLVVLAASVAVALYLGRTENRKYKAEAMAILNGSISQTVMEVTQQLALSSPLSDDTKLSTKLGLPDSIARNIAGIESFYVIDYLNDSTPDMVDFKRRHSLEDTLNVRMPNRLYFRVKTKNVRQLPAFEQAFTDYFNRNERLVKEFNVKRANLQGEISLLDAEIHRIDSMATITYLHEPYMQAQIKWNTLLFGEQERQMLYGDLLFLQKLKGKREAELANCTAPVVLPDGFMVMPRPVYGRIFYLVICGVIGAFVAMLIELLIEHRKTILNYLFKK